MSELTSPGSPQGLDLASIKAREAAATKGPWHWGWHDKSLQSLSGPCELMDHILSTSPCASCQKTALKDAKAGKSVCLSGSPEDQGFIAHARTDIPKLIAEVERLRAALRSSRTPQEPHQPPAVHHMCRPSNLPDAPPFASWCHHVRTWVDGAAQQDDYTCSACGTKISTNISEWSEPAPVLPPSADQGAPKEPDAIGLLMEAVAGLSQGACFTCGAEPGCNIDCRAASG